MLFRKFEKINAKPSLLGFGTMRLPKLYADKEDIDYEKAEAMIDEAYARGVNYFDTAYPYHAQMSEAFIGHALKKYPRESFYLADKLPGWFVKAREDVDRIFEEQLERCQVEYFDFYLCHALNQNSFKLYEELNIYDMLAERKAKGQIRHLGFSFHDTPEALEYIIDKYPWDFVQIQLNYLDWERQNAKRQYEVCQERGIPCVIMEPVRGGTLASLCDEAVDVLKEDNPDASIASWAIRYAASLPGVMTVLSGMTTMEQVEDNLKTMGDFHPLSEEEYIAIDKAKEIFLKNTTVPCTGCRYCMDCPAGVDIPAMFKLYNDYRIGKFAPGFIQGYGKQSGHNADGCVACGTCMSHCPQSIKIPELMEEIRKCYLKLKR